MSWKCKIFGHKFKKRVCSQYCKRCGYSKITTKKIEGVTSNGAKVRQGKCDL